MSMPEFSENAPDREQAVNMILASIAMEELSLSHILNAEGEKIQSVLGTLPNSPQPAEPVKLSEILEINRSVNATLSAAAQYEMLLNQKLAEVLSPYNGECPEKVFLSSYMEALADTQTVMSNGLISFDPETSDSVGENITINEDGTEFTITKPGLYEVTWTVNLGNGTALPAIIGTLENGEPASGAAASSLGSFSSGTLIEVTDVPYTLSLYNYGGGITLDAPPPWANSAGSIRIVRFASGQSS